MIRVGIAGWFGVDLHVPAVAAVAAVSGHTRWWRWLGGPRTKAKLISRMNTQLRPHFNTAPLHKAFSLEFPRYPIPGALPLATMQMRFQRVPNQMKGLSFEPSHLAQSWAMRVPI